ncbi:MAG: SLC13/DASS family transporter [Gammaproteobacteria bacterium]|nr:SLC13/DASS family transporter [Gammaproteobacteria bacterium]
MAEHDRQTSPRGRAIGFWLGVGCFLLLLALPIDPANLPASRLAAVASLMAIWWVSNALPLFATAILPLVLFPLLGIMSGNDVAPVYFNSTIVLFLGGFMIALTMERWNLHKRIALGIIHAVGGGPPRIILGFMVAAAFLSMWISNTATAVMMVPIGLAMVLQVEETAGAAHSRTFTIALMLGIAYGCSMGGLTTLVGTPPNLSFQRIFQIIFPEAPPIDFGTWIVMGLPIGVTMIAVAWLLLTHVLYRPSPEVRIERDILERERAGLGPISFEERSVAIVFAMTALLWVFRRDLELGVATGPGGSNLLPYAGMIDDGTVAITMAAVLFFIPTRNRTPHAAGVRAGSAIPKWLEPLGWAVRFGAANRVMGAEVIPRLPWNIVLLFGGGFALAAGFQGTGLANIIGSQFQGLGGLPDFVVILLVCLTLTFLTELTSNLATTEMILPILASVAVLTEMNPLILMVPATLSASCAFMMPVATPPNAIVFGSDRISVGEMARAGIFLNLIGALVIATLVLTLGETVFGIESGVMPEWATQAAPGEIGG